MNKRSYKKGRNRIRPYCRVQVVELGRQRVIELDSRTYCTEVEVVTDFTPAPLPAEREMIVISPEICELFNEEAPLVVREKRQGFCSPAGDLQEKEEWLAALLLTCPQAPARRSRQGAIEK